LLVLLNDDIVSTSRQRSFKEKEIRSTLCSRLVSLCH